MQRRRSTYRNSLQTWSFEYLSFYRLCVLHDHLSSAHLKYDHCNFYVNHLSNIFIYSINHVTIKTTKTSSTVEEIDIQSEKVFKYQRCDGIKQIVEKTTIPPPLVFIEYLYYLVNFIKSYIDGSSIERTNNFSEQYLLTDYQYLNTSNNNLILEIEKIDEETKEAYIKFELDQRNKIFKESKTTTNENKEIRFANI